MFGVIDRFEGEVAVIVLDDGKVMDFKKEVLPEGVKEGDVLNIGDVITLNKEETEKRKKDFKKYLDLWED